MDTPHLAAHVILLLIFLGAVALWVWSGIWASRDATKRGKPGILVGLLVMFISWPISLLVWIALRPENIRPPFDLNRFRVQ
jgi:Na+/proline symporter